MSVMRRVLTTASAVLLFCTGLVQTLRWAGRPALREWLDAQVALFQPLEKSPTAWFLMDPMHAWWYLLMAISLGAFVLWLMDLFSDRILSLATEAGHPLKIRATAINRYLHDCLSALPFIRGARVESHSKAGALHTRVRVWVAATDKLDNLQEAILRQVVDDARRGLGLTRVEQPDVLVEAVKARRHKAKNETGSEVVEPVPPAPDAGSGSLTL